MPSVRAVVLLGEGKSFCAGADLNWMKEMAGYDDAKNLADAKAIAWMLRTLYLLGKPTIARVHGSAFGGGVGLVACCDIAFAAQDATFSLSEAKLGLIPAAISPYVVEAIGARQARRYFLSAERFTAAEAFRIGLVHDIYPFAELDGRINELLGALLLAGPRAQAGGKALIRAVASRPDRRERDRRHGGPHRASARVGGRQGRRGGVPRQARAGVGARGVARAADRRERRRDGPMSTLPGMASFDTWQLVALAAAVGWASGIRLYAVLFVVGGLGYLGWVDLPGGLATLAHPWVLAASGFMFCVEFFADKIPGVDSVWDFVHTFIRIPAGAALAASVFGDSNAAATLAAAIVGGSLAAGQSFREGRQPRVDQHVAGTVLELVRVVRRGARGRNRAVARVHASDRGADRARSHRLADDLAHPEGLAIPAGAAPQS